MAETLSSKVADNDVVGALVYEAYSTVKCGKVIEDLGPQKVTKLHGETFVSTFHDLRVRWLKGGESIVSSSKLNNFEELVEDHRRKLERHMKTLEALKLL